MFDMPSKPMSCASALLLALLISGAAPQAAPSAPFAASAPPAAFVLSEPVDPARATLIRSGSGLRPGSAGAPALQLALPQQSRLTDHHWSESPPGDVARLNQRLAADNRRHTPPKPRWGLYTGDCNYSVTPGRYERGAVEGGRNFLCTR